ncbi:MAG: efflux RND transporter permease subunit [bacterium]
MNLSTLLSKWSKFFMDRYRVTILIIIAILLGGFWGISNNQRQDFPAIPTNFIFVQAIYPGASSADVEREVVIPIEQAVNGIDGVGSIRSTAANNYAFLSIEMESVPKTLKAASEINEEITKTTLPDGVEADVQILEPVGPAVAYGLIGANGETTNDLLALVDKIKPRLESASNEIDYIEVVPENEFQVVIKLDGAKLAQVGLSFDIVKQTIQSQITSLPGGQVETADGKRQQINIQAPSQSLDKLKSIAFGPVTLNDLAEITRQPKDDESIHYGGFVKDGEAFSREAVYLMAYKKDDGDIIRIVDATDQAIEEIKADGLLPEGVDIVSLYDSSPYIEDQISSLVQNGYIGLILILIVLLFFINFRTSLVVALIIPLAFLVTLFILYIIGFSLNILTLFALILTLGILIDNAIVIAEGIVHEIDHGAKRYQAALTAIKKFGPAVTAATITTVIVFIPFASIGGIMGEFLKYIPYTIMIMLVVSYFLAITITPLFGRLIMREETKEQRAQKKLRSWEKALVLPAIVHYGQNSLNWIRSKYGKFMNSVINSGWKKLWVLIVVTLLLATSFSVFAPMLKFEQFPTNDGANIQVDLDFPTGTPFAVKKDVFVRVQNEALTLPYFQNFYVFGNQIYLTFVEPADRTDDTKIFDIEDEYKQRVAKVKEEIDPEIGIKIQAASYGPPESSSDIVVEFVSTDSEVLKKSADDLIAFLNDQENILEIENGLEELSQPSVRVALDQDKIQAGGVNSLAAAGTVNAVFAEQKIGSFVTREDGVSDELSLAFSDASTDSVDDLRGLIVPTLTGRTVQLSDIANVEEVELLIEVSRLNSKRVATVNVKLSEDAPDTARAELDTAVKDYLNEDKLKELGLQSDGVVYGGLYASFQDDYSNLQIVFLLALIFVYLVLVNQFNSFMQPALILFTVPLAMIGVFPGLKIVGSSLNMISGLGVIALVGVVVNDAIVFIDSLNRYRRELPEATWREVIVRTGHSRFKPIFSTSITTIGGILPLTIIDPFWRGLGTAIISGLVFSTIGTLIAIPTLYAIFKRDKKKPEDSQSSSGASA